MTKTVAASDPFAKKSGENDLKAKSNNSRGNRRARENRSDLYDGKEKASGGAESAAICTAKAKNPGLTSAPQRSSFQSKTGGSPTKLGEQQDNKGKASGEKKDGANGTQGNDKKKPEQGKKDSKIASGINKQSTATILFVKNIDAMATEKELKEFFNKFGNVKNVEKAKAEANTGEVHCVCLVQLSEIP